MSTARLKTASIVLLLLAVFGIGGWYYAATSAAHRHALEKTTTAEGKVIWTCAMHPEVRMEAPGQCPICGMALIKAAPEKPAAAATPADGFVQIDPRMLQNLGVRTLKLQGGGAAGGAAGGAIDAVGTVSADETRLVAVTSRSDGFVERLGVNAVGERVTRGQLIAALYSPALYAAQEEFALVAKTDPTLAAASRQRLALLGLPAAQIERLARGGSAQRQTPLLSPVDGVITELSVREGTQATPGMPLARIADLSRVWMLADVGEAQSAALQAGAPATARVAALPGRVFEGRVDYQYPSIDSATRTRRARIVFDNADGALLPGMYAQLRISTGGDAGSDTLLVPSEAVIRSGRHDVVIVAEGQGGFRVARVRVGSERGDHIEVLEGLEPGDEVVTSGQFLIDSEASLRGALSRLDHAGH